MLMDIEKQQIGRRHNYGNLEEQSLAPWYLMQQQYKEQDVLGINIDLLNIVAERDAAIEERNKAFLEKEKAFEDRQVAITQRNLAIKQRNDAVLERNNAFINLQQSMIEPITFEKQPPIEVPNVLCKTKASSECRNSPHTKRGYNRPSVRPRKRKPTGDVFDYDETVMPVPGCTCTGVFRQCYKWGNGGWQSCCCTNTMSAYPLPLVPNKRYGRKGGRKMTGSAFSKLLSRLAIEGYDFSRPVDLKEHWSKHEQDHRCINLFYIRFCTNLAVTNCRPKRGVKMPLYDCVMLLKPHLKGETVMDLIARVGKHVYARNGVITDIKNFQTVQLGYGIKKLDGRYFQGKLLQMTMMATPNINKELHYLNKDDRLLRWLLVKHRDAKYGLHYVNDNRNDPSKFPRSKYGLDFLADEIGKGELGSFSRSSIFADQDADDKEDDDCDEYEVNPEEPDAEKTEV
ncbi:hypothetical protein RND81_09G169100 [Saponaria officinalis]|uniref:GAGA-binding transcriptional activator n=1 Tax=Saponaria officinalis TaxID=3572 RepID=A0AAW1ILQ1_SAPOF